MQWWIQTPNAAMAVDNQLVTGMDFSLCPAVTPDMFLVMWRENRGEIERGDGTNGTPSPIYEGIGNGMREIFIDITPWTSLFQQFLTKAPNLTLDQAKKIQIDLITTLFNTKRQFPVHYIVTAGDFWWEGTDSAAGHMAIAMLPHLTGVVGDTTQSDSLVSQLNANYAAMAADINSSIVDRVNTYITSVLNSLVSEINSGIVTNGNNALANVYGEINTNVVAPGNNAMAQINNIFAEINSDIVDAGNNAFSSINAIFGSANSGVVDEANYLTSFVNTAIVGRMNSYLLTSALGTSGTSVAAPGLPGAFSNTDAGFTHFGTNPYTLSVIGNNSYVLSYVADNGYTFTAVDLSFTGPNHIGAPSVGIGGPAGMTIPWTPIGHNTPVNLSGGEMNNIMLLITNRRTSLLTVKVNKTDEVNALTSIASVIAYDVTTGWPVIPLPPGYVPDEPPVGGGVTLAGTPIVTSGVPEAPSDGVTYGRQNAAWNPALAKSGDVLDGGNF